jgi:putative transcriptional regulator
VDSEQNIRLSKGLTLVAHPFINDGWFRRSVVLLAEHNKNGSLGFVLNKPAFVRIKDILPNYPDVIYPVLSGGPVAENQLFFLHRFPQDVEGSLSIGSGYFWGGNFHQLMELIRKRVAGFETTRFFMGYSGWESGQLEHEVNEKAWMLQKSSISELLKFQTQDCWGNMLKKMGSNFSVLADYPFEPSMN